MSDVKKAVSELKKGNFVIVVDEKTRENEGDLVLAAKFASPQAINFMIKNARGLVCVPMLKDRLKELDIGLMVPPKKNTENTQCSFTVSVDYKPKTTTGVSAYDRAETIKALIEPESKPNEFAKPGHVFPLMYQKGGVLERPGHTEAAIDLCKLADIYPAGVICEIIKDDGKMARMPYLKKFSAQYEIPIVAIKDLIEFLNQ